MVKVVPSDWIEIPAYARAAVFQESVLRGCVAPTAGWSDLAGAPLSASSESR